MFQKAKLYESRMKCNKQKNIFVCISRKAKRGCYENLHLKDITDNKKKSGYCKTPLSKKIKSTDYINLEENKKIINNDKDIAGFSAIFSEYNTQFRNKY